MAFRQADGRIAMIWRAVPIIFALFLAANVAAIFVLGKLGGTARGDRLTVHFSTTCAEQAAPIMKTRAESLGLGEPTWEVAGDTIVLTATMPGLDDDRTAVPALLAQRGQLEIWLGPELVATQEDLESATLELDEVGMPYDQLAFSPEVGERLAAKVAAAPEGELVFVLDGEELARRPNSIKVEKAQLKVIAGAGPTRERFRRATDRAIVLGHGALPCAVTPTTVVDAEAGR